MTPEWLGGVYTEADVTVPLGPICEREGVRFVQARAVALDRDAREVVLADGRRIGYDVVAFDIGAVNPGRDDAERGRPHQAAVADRGVGTIPRRARLPAPAARGW